jgi:hypothetical protein
MIAGLVISNARLLIFLMGLAVQQRWVYADENWVALVFGVSALELSFCSLSSMSFISNCLNNWD